MSSHTVQPRWESTNVTSGDILAFDARESDCVAMVGDGGVYRVYHSGDGGRVWSSDWPDLPGDLLVTALSASRDGVYVGLLMKGVLTAAYRRGRGTRPVWREVSEGLPADASISALAASDDAVYVGTRRHGIFTRSVGTGAHDAAWQPLASCGCGSTNVEVITCLAVLGDSVIAGGPRNLHGLMSDGSSRSLNPCVAGACTPVHVHGAGSDRIIGWSARSVYISEDGGTSWLCLPEVPAEGAYIRSAAAAGSSIFAGLHGRHGAGVRRWGPGSEGWEPCAVGLPSPSWSAVVFALPTALLAGIESHGIFRLAVAEPDVPSATFTLEAAADSLYLMLHRDEDVRVDICGPDGTCFRSLALGTLSAGPHEVPLDDKGLPIGLYTCTVCAGGLSRSVRRLVLE